MNRIYSRLLIAVGMGLIPMLAAADSIRRDDRPERIPHDGFLDHHHSAVVVAPGAVEQLTVVGSTNWIALNVHGLPGVDFSQSVVGLRFQLFFAKTNSIYVAAEGIYEGRRVSGSGAFELTPSVGGGLRFQIPVLSDEENALLVSPGVDVIVALGDPDQEWRKADIPYTNITFVASSVDVSWVRKFSQHFAFELGVTLGADVSLGGINAQAHETDGEWFPQFNLFTGVRFFE